MDATGQDPGGPPAAGGSGGAGGPADGERPGGQGGPDAPAAGAGDGTAGLPPLPDSGPAVGSGPAWGAGPAWESGRPWDSARPWDPGRSWDGARPGASDGPWVQGPPPPRRPAPARRGLARYAASAVAALAKIKVLLLAGSVLLSLLAYGVAFGWKFGALFLLILALHETGHSLAIRSRGLPASLPVFIPFLGALINLRRRPRDAAEEAFIAAAGPAFGLAASYGLLAAGIALHVPVFAVAAGFGMLIHVFNLLPVTPLDGGRTVAFLRWKAWIPGFLALVVLLFYSPADHGFALTDPLAPVILAFIVYNVALEARRRPPSAYDAIPARTKWTYAAVWLGLLVLAGGGYVLAPRPGLV